jgi:phosphate transport system protein
MSHYEARLESDLGQIRSQLRALGASLEAALRQSVRALLTGNRDLAWDTILQDQAVNRRVTEIDRLCHAFVARHLPSARHLRFVSSVLRINISLERVGDYAVTICREATRIGTIPEALRREVELRGEEAVHLLHHALLAFYDSNPDSARATRKMASGLTRAYDGLLTSLVQACESGSLRLEDSFSLLLVFNRLSRACDQAKNVCEEAVFVATGEEKRGKNFRILFLDRRNDGFGQLARRWAEVEFGERARIACAGLEPAAQLDPAWASLLVQNGVNPDEVPPVSLASLPDALQGQDLVVALEPQLKPRLGRLPYHTVFVEWELGGPTSPAPGETEGRQARTAAFRSNLAELRSILIGESRD